jgi:hypothetical protein
MDTVCLKPFDFEEDFIFSSESSDPYNRFLVNNTFIKSPAGAKYLKDCLDFLSLRGHNHIHWGELGVNTLSRMVFRNRLGQYIRQPDHFCPISGYQLKHLIDDSKITLPDTSYALHWWNELWRRTGIDKNGKFPEKSLYEILKRKYL